MSSSTIFLLLKIVQIHILIRYLWNCSNILLSLSARKKETINYFKNPNWTRSRIIQRKRARSIYSSIIFLLLTIVRILKSFLIRINLALNIYLPFSYYRGIRRPVQFSRERSSLLIEIRVHKTGRESGKQSGGTK